MNSARSHLHPERQKEHTVEGGHPSSEEPKDIQTPSRDRRSRSGRARSREIAYDSPRKLPDQDFPIRKLPPDQGWSVSNVPRRCPAPRFHLSRTPVSRLWIPHHDQRHRPRSPLSRLADAPKSVTRRPVDSPSFRGRRSRYRAAGNSATPSRQVAEFVVRRAIELPSLPCAEAPMSLVADLPSRRAFKSPRLSLADVAESFLAESSRRPSPMSDIADLLVDSGFHSLKYLPL
jgi:hypothetical protein